MTESPAPPEPDRTPDGQANAVDDRDARLAAALRANLARRKAQRRARDAGTAPDAALRDRG
jgi:hypothetical protein